MSATRAGSAVVVSLLLVQAALAQPTRYTLTDLGPGSAHGVNNDGIVVGSRDGQAIMWNLQRPIVLWGEVGGVSVATRINGTGQVVGKRQDQNRCKPLPCFPMLAIWEEGALVDIEARFGSPPPISYGADINDAGQVASEGILFDLATDTFRPYIDVTDMGFTASAINNDGIVAGRWHGFSAEFMLAGLWTAIDGGTITPISLPDDFGSNANDISDNGIVVGLSFNSNQLARPFSWSDGIPVDLEARCIDNYANPVAVNSVGTIVGDSCSQALVWHGARAFDLRTLVADPQGLFLLQANDVSNSGFIVGAAVTKAGEARAFVLTPIACSADWNGSGIVNSQDFFDFLSDFFDTGADFNFSGETTSADFFAFVEAFFAKCS